MTTCEHNQNNKRTGKQFDWLAKRRQICMAFGWFRGNVKQIIPNCFIATFLVFILFVCLFQFSALYLGSLAFVIIGVIVYNLKPTPRHPSVAQPLLSYRQLEQDSQQSDDSLSSSSQLHDHVTTVCCQKLRNVAK